MNYEYSLITQYILIHTANKSQQKYFMNYGTDWMATNFSFTDHPHQSSGKLLKLGSPGLFLNVMVKNLLRIR